MRVSHKPGQVSAVFDDPNLVTCAGLTPVGCAGKAVWPDRPGRQQAHTARAGWGECAPEGPGAGRRDGCWGGQHR